MNDQSIPSLQLPPQRPRSFRRLLDWVLLCTLLGALFGVRQSLEKLGDFGTRWSYEALILGVYFAFVGARLGCVAGSSWIVARRFGLPAGILSGVFLGLAAHLVLRTLFPFFAFQIVRAPEPILAGMQHALEDALIELPAIFIEVIAMSAFFGCTSWATGRILATSPSPGSSTSAVPADDQPVNHQELEEANPVHAAQDGCAQKHVSRRNCS